MHSHRFLVAVIAALVAALAGVPGFAHAGGDERAPSPTSRIGSASAWRTIAFDDALTTARCVGDPRTPVCAVETVYGCFVRGGEMCRNIIADADFAEVLPSGAIPTMRFISGCCGSAIRILKTGCSIRGSMLMNSFDHVPLMSL